MKKPGRRTAAPISATVDSSLIQSPDPLVPGCFFTEQDEVRKNVQSPPLPLAAAMIAGLGYVSSAQALFEDNDARIAINAMRKDMVTMQAQISRLENGQKASLALSDQIASLQERQSVLSGRLETLENRIAQQEKIPGISTPISTAV